MLNKKIARRYAKALIEIGKEEDKLEQFKGELKAFSKLLKEFPELNACLTSPIYSTEELRGIVSFLNKKLNLSDTILNFLYLLIDKRRAIYFEEIIASYEDFINEIFGYVKAKIITPKPLPKKNYEKIKEVLERVTEKKILLEAKTDPQIIGGVIAEVGDKVFDGSIRNQLQKMREKLA
jgi:F-type H+-transporting ATPase subunit delta